MDVLMMTAEPRGDTVVPALSLLGHSLRMARRNVDAVTAARQADVAFVDARSDLSAAREMCRYLATASPAPVVAVVKTGDMVAVDPGWKIDDILSPEAGPAELDARLRLLTRRRPGDDEDTEIRLGELIMNERTYSARLQRRPLQLAHQEFELLKYLVTYPGRVFTRRHLLQEVWGFNYVGGSRTVDVHVRRIRAKLGREHESLIATVRNVGYKAVAPSRAE